jgi:hypothetical protein
MNAESPEDFFAHVARRERLSVLCALDRAAFRLTLRKPAPAPASSAGPSGHGGLGNVLAVTQFFPGAIGRWSRRLARGGSVLRALF